MNCWTIKRMTDSAAAQGWYIKHSPRKWELKLLRLTSVRSLPSPASVSNPCSNKQKTGARHYPKPLSAEEHKTQWIPEYPSCLACLSETGRHLAVWADFWILPKSLLIRRKERRGLNLPVWACLHFQGAQ